MTAVGVPAQGAEDLAIARAHMNELMEKVSQLKEALDGKERRVKALLSTSHEKDRRLAEAEGERQDRRLAEAEGERQDRRLAEAKGERPKECSVKYATAVHDKQSSSTCLMVARSDPTRWVQRATGP